MALRPEQRYRFPRELADDIDHWLADKPVTAYRDSWLARLARWGRRHRPLVAAAMALLMTAVAALAAGVAVVRGERDRTEQARRQTREALDARSAVAPNKRALAMNARLMEARLLSSPMMNRMLGFLLLAGFCTRAVGEGFPAPATANSGQRSTVFAAPCARWIWRVTALQPPVS
jgi:hypothetical protein